MLLHAAELSVYGVCVWCVCVRCVPRSCPSCCRAECVWCVCVWCVPRSYPSCCRAECVWCVCVWCVCVRCVPRSCPSCCRAECVSGPAAAVAGPGCSSGPAALCSPPHCAAGLSPAHTHTAHCAAAVPAAQTHTHTRGRGCQGKATTTNKQNCSKSQQIHACFIQMCLSYRSSLRCVSESLLMKFYSLINTFSSQLHILLGLLQPTGTRRHRQLNHTI